MKKEKHPQYQQVLFIDSSTGHQFVCGASLSCKETAKFEGKEYPVYRAPITSHSHPFFAGSSGLVDAEGRIDKFKKRYQAKAAPAPKPVEEKKPAAKKTKK